MFSLYLFFTVTFLTRGIIGWYAVLKVGDQGLDGDVTLAELWMGNDVLNEDNAAQVQDTYPTKEMPSYKSSIINNQWNNVRLAKVGVYKEGREAAYFIFNTTRTDKITWFNSSKIIESSYQDLSYPEATCILYNENTTRTFAIISSPEEANCTMYSGWLVTVDDSTSSKCHWEYGYHKPFFLYSQTKRRVPFHNVSSAADSFVVFVDDCVSGPCQYGGTCTPSKTDYTCQCADQLYGKNCHINCPCQAGKCISITQDDITGDGVVVDGVIINQGPVYPEPGVIVACQCEKGMEGPYCNKSVNDCKVDSCSNGGACIDGDNSYTCMCPPGFSGDTCQFSENSLHGHTNKDSLVAKVALGVVIPVVVLVVAAIIAYGVYMYRHPDKFGRSATYKNYVIAREFVRRSIRRVSGRRQKQKLSENGDAVDIDDKENLASKSGKDHVDASHVNLGFQEGDDRQYKSAVPVYKRENSEYYNLSPTDAAVVAGPDAYAMDQQQGGAQNQEQNKGTKPQRQLGRAYRNKSNSSAPRSPNDVQSPSLIAGNSQQQPLPSPRTPGYSPANTAPSPRTADERDHPTSHSQPSHKKNKPLVPSVQDDEDFGFLPTKQTDKSSKPPSTSSYSSADRYHPDHRQSEPRSEHDGYEVPRKYADDSYRGHRYDDRTPSGDPKDRYNTPNPGHNAGGRPDPRDMYYAAHSPRDQHLNKPSNEEPRERYNSPQDRYNDRDAGVDPSDRYLSPYSKGVPGDRYNTANAPPPNDRYNAPRYNPADRYNDGSLEDHPPTRSPRYMGSEQPQYNYHNQRSPNQTGSEHARIVFPSSDGMDDLTI